MPLLFLLCALGVVRAEEAFTGGTAAYTDWAVRRCEVNPSDKLRTLVDNAKAASEARFSEQYLKAFHGKELTEANAAAGVAAKLCEKIGEWYGAGGSRIAGLLARPGKSEASTPSAPPAQRGRRDKSPGGPGGMKGP